MRAALQGAKRVVVLEKSFSVGLGGVVSTDVRLALSGLHLHGYTVVAGLGGQGVLRASDILADVALRAGLDVKKSEIKGMSQRGGSVTSDVRFGEAVLSPMVPPGAADYLLVLEPTQVEPHKHYLKPGGTLITPDAIKADKLPNKKALNVALLGA